MLLTDPTGIFALIVLAVPLTKVLCFVCVFGVENLCPKVSTTAERIAYLTDPVLVGVLVAFAAFWAFVNLTGKQTPLRSFSSVLSAQTDRHTPF